MSEGKEYYEALMYRSLPLFCEAAMKIRVKSGALIPFEMNYVQKKLNGLLEKQLRETGRVRAIVLKGRQMGISTFIAARFYHRVTYNEGFKCLVMAHEQKASKNLFGMVRTYYDNDIRDVRANTDSAIELRFSGGSGYMVATAGSRETGRGQTFQVVHGSEVGFWDNAESHVAGALQALSSEDGTECILESTANGYNYFYDAWQKAVIGENGFLPVFLPWYWHEEYRDKVPKDFNPSEEDLEYIRLYNLDDGQAAWYIRKKAELGEWRFKQEYPGNAAEAFQVSGENRLIPINDIVAARKRKIENNGATIKVGGLDIGRKRDRTVCMVRLGREVIDCEVLSRGDDTMAAAGLGLKMLKKHNLAFLFVDEIGIGGGVVDRLHEMGYANQVIGVNVGNSLKDDEPYFNLRSKVYGKLRDWIKTASIPDRDDLQLDLSRVNHTLDSRGRLKLAAKEDPSPDLSDALSLTFSYDLNEFDNKDVSEYSSLNVLPSVSMFSIPGREQYIGAAY